MTELASSGISSIWAEVEAELRQIWAVIKRKKDQKKKEKKEEEKKTWNKWKK